MVVCFCMCALGPENNTLLAYVIETPSIDSHFGREKDMTNLNQPLCHVVSKDTVIQIHQFYKRGKSHKHLTM